MPTTTPLVLVGDGLWQPTGLGRIIRELHTHLTEADLPITVSAVGWEPGEATGGAPWYTRHQDSQTWGQHALARHWARHVDPRQLGVVWTIQDPARCFPLRRAALGANARWWGYFPVDAHDRTGGLHGPAAATVQSYDRVLAYGAYAKPVLDTPDALPHGLTNVWRPTLSQASWETVGQYWSPMVQPDSVVVGAVATNQPRKDLGLLFETIALMRQADPKVRLWLHTDREVTAAWSIPQLADVYGLGRHISVTTSLTDDELAALYSWCAVTVAPGLGEGFGYPIVESLACGTPVVHGTYGGGAELVPTPAWRFPERLYRVEGAHALLRPVYTPQDVANAAWRAIEWRRAEPDAVRAYCVGSVAHLRWEALWPRWREWVQAGLEQL